LAADLAAAEVLLLASTCPAAEFHTVASVSGPTAPGAHAECKDRCLTRRAQTEKLRGVRREWHLRRCLLLFNLTYTRSERDEGSENDVLHRGRGRTSVTDSSMSLWRAGGGDYCHPV